MIRTNRSSENGFSLIELLIVVVVIGIVAALAIPAFQKATRAAENGNVYATLRTVNSTEASFFTQNGRFARVTEINNILGGSLGTNAVNSVNRGKFVITMTPPNPTDVELRDGYVITATRDVPSEGLTYVYELTQSGYTTQIYP